MFSSKADLSGIFGAKNLYVSGAFHKAAFEVRFLKNLFISVFAKPFRLLNKNSC